jgi:hypothetical protein
VFGLVTTSSVARDSTWLLCSSDSLVLSVHEHRAGSAGRETSLTLIYGVHQLHAALQNTDSGAVKLSSATRAGETNFTGKASVDYESDKVVLTGTLKINGEPARVKTTMQCKEMSSEFSFED